MKPSDLPIDAFLPEARALLKANGALVLTAEPGAGKTTRLPPALLGSAGQIWVLEPRRLAARLAATRVASELGEALGDTVGYQVRFDRRAGPRTRLRYVTEGLLVRRLSSGDALAELSTVVLDEFHERHLETDLALTLVDRLRRGPRPDLRVVVMSATLDTEPLSQFMSAPTLAVPGRLHPIEIEHARHRDDRRLEEQVHAALARLLDDGLDGHVLVFLPGVGEIRRCERALAQLAQADDLALLPLHGQLEARDLDAALRPSRRRKVLLATNVAESSVTIDGVEAVIDSGLHRVAGSAAGTGLRTLELAPISKASAVQRANRAGRQRPGRCLRLYTKVDFDRRPRAPTPELLREDLSGPLLHIRAAGAADLDAVRWLDPPPAAALEEADSLLAALGATQGGALTHEGRDLLRYPLPPRLARVVSEGAARGVGARAAGAAALLSERSILLPSTRDSPAREEGPSDVLYLLDLLDEARDLRFDARRLRALGVDSRAARRVDRVRAQLTRLLPKDSRQEGDEAALLLALLAGHPDRVAVRREGDALVLARGGAARLSPQSVVGSAAWLVVLDALDSRAQGRATRVRLASAIQPDWLLELFAEDLTEERKLTWDSHRQRVEGTWSLSYGQLVLEADREEGDPEEAAAVLREAALDAGPAAFCKDKALAEFLLRLRFARRLSPALSQVGDAEVRETLAGLCEGKRSFAALRQADLLAHVRVLLDPDQLRQLERLAPASVTLTGGRRCPVTYEDRQDPWIKSRLQDFFGMQTGPVVGGGAVKLVLHLLAPNKTAVSVTSDLESFWTRHYPTERKRLKRRYPKHLWPEDPMTAKPPKPGRIR